MHKQSWEKNLIDRLAELDMPNVLSIVNEKIKKVEPLKIVQICQEGVRLVGEKYEKQEFFLAGLIMAGEVLQKVTDIIQPHLEKNNYPHKIGRVLLGTVQGDIHDIGKNLVHALLCCHGFDVYDLGVDVPPEEFIHATKNYKPHIIGLSGLVSPSFESMRTTTTLIKNELSLDNVPIIIVGGGLIDEEVCRYVNANYWTRDAMEGVRFCQEVMISV
jgi:methanogenic corrinoid protein MtbC1